MTFLLQISFDHAQDKKKAAHQTARLSLAMIIIPRIISLVVGQNKFSLLSPFAEGNAAEATIITHARKNKLGEVLF